MESIKEASDLQQYLTFLLAGEEYVMNILRVREIIEYPMLTAIPRAPKCIRGVFNLRGSVVPAIDLAVKFGLGERPVTKTTCIVIVEGQFERQLATLGVIADSVSQVVGLPKDEILPVPLFGTRVQLDYLLGMAQLGNKFALLLDVDKVLSSDELLNVSEVSTRAESLGEIESTTVRPAVPGSVGSSKYNESPRK